jgi:fumarylpyruvate hydrolase
LSDFVIPPPDIPFIPTKTAGAFPVRRVNCIGRNYAAHAVEVGHDPDREGPFFFQKNPNNLDPSGSFPYPAQSGDVHHEVEMLVALKSEGTDIPAAVACLGLRRGLGYDAARSARGGQESGPPLGNRKSL